jgi:hypothetical protein
VLQCPNCKETIDASSQQCRFCSAAIDPAAAEAAAQVMARVNQACSDSSFLKTAVVTMLIFLGVMFVPFLGLLGVVGFYFLTFAVPVLSIRWWVRFGHIQCDDPDFIRAKRTMLIVTSLTSLLLIWVLFRWISIIALLLRHR